MFLSDYLEFENELEEFGVFDPLLDKDSNFFINVVRLRKTTVPEFQKSYKRINDFFSTIATLLEASDNIGDRMYREALRLFDFSEVNGINLGFSESKYGAGFGIGLRKQVIGDAFEIVKKGSKQPEIFQLVGLFEENVGPDRLSDMIATIIQNDIIDYTKKINRSLNICPQKYPNYQFTKDGLLINPYKGCEVFCLPIEILHELPIAKDWGDIDRVASENRAIREEINSQISKEWHRWASGEKKRYLKEWIFKNPERGARVIDGYRQEEVPELDISADLEYYIQTIFKNLKSSGISFLSRNPGEKSSYQVALEVINIFKEWVEYNRGWDVIQSADSRKREKIVQRLIHLGAKNYITTNKMDISFEPDAGRGPVDFKVSKGDDITVVEVKLSSNSQYLHGYEIQVEEYAMAEHALYRIYVMLDLGNPGRVKKLLDKHEERLDMGEDCPELIIIDSTEKDSASIS